MAEDKKDFELVTLRTGIDPLFFADTLTTDVELRDALYDLIDNSIDAARNVIISRTDYETDNFGLPTNYFDFEVTIKLAPKTIEVSDNCFGIDGSTIEGKVFYTGEKSSHRFGIGYYGIGLKRALLKAGRKFSFETDNGQYLYTAEFEHNALSGDQENTLDAKRYPSKGNNVGTTFKVLDLKAETLNQITNLEWWEETLNLLSIRYSIFLKKGFSIVLENKCFSKPVKEKVAASLPSISAPKFFSDISASGGKEIKEHFKGVSVFYHLGVHQKYRFLGEPGSDAKLTPKKNESITKEFGIYFICNDRVIVGPTFDKKYGFSATYHSEYGGFLCYVYMVSENPGSLPWNTAKTELKIHSPLFIAARKQIEPLTKKYISKARSIIRFWNKKETKDLPFVTRQAIFQYHYGLIDEKPEIPKKPVAGQSPSNQGGSATTLNNNRNRELLIDHKNCQTEVPPGRKKEYAVFWELHSARTDLPITAVVLLRVFVEMTVKQTQIALSGKIENLSTTCENVANKLFNQGIIDRPLKLLIDRYTNSKDPSFFTFNNIQSYIHDTKSFPDQSRVITYWDELDPFLAKCWEVINAADEKKKLAKVVK